MSLSFFPLLASPPRPPLRYIAEGEANHPNDAKYSAYRQGARAVYYPTGTSSPTHSTNMACRSAPDVRSKLASISSGAAIR
jgi:hypothetical protein